MLVLLFHFKSSVLLNTHRLLTSTSSFSLSSLLARCTKTKQFFFVLFVKTHSVRYCPRVSKMVGKKMTLSLTVCSYILLYLKRIKSPLKWNACFYNKGSFLLWKVNMSLLSLEGVCTMHKVNTSSRDVPVNNNNKHQLQRQRQMTAIYIYTAWCR